MKAKEQKQKEVDELVARDLECKEAAETVKKLELELKEKEAKQKEYQEIEKELKKKEAVEAERDALQTNLADLKKTKDCCFSHWNQRVEVQRVQMIPEVHE